MRLLPRLRVFPFLVLACALVPLRAATSPYVWDNVAINGGGYVSGVVFHPKQKDVIYARTDVGGAYRWSASAQKWIPLNDDIGYDDSQLLGVLSIAVDPSNANKVYLAVGQYLAWWAHKAAILRSSDGGNTWSRTDLSFDLGGNADGRSAGERLQVDPNNPNILFLGSNQDGLWRSADAGATWSKVAGFSPTGVNFVLFDPSSAGASGASQVIYAGADSTTTALYLSTDGGTTWAPAPGQPSSTSGLRAFRAVIDPSGVVYCTYDDAPGPNGVGKGLVLKFDRGSSSWTNITPPTGQGGFAGISIDATHPSTLVVSTLDRWSPGDEIYRSTDGGATWKGTLTGTTLDYSSAAWPQGTVAPHWIGDVEIDPFNPDRVMFITGYGLFATSNMTAADSGRTVTWSFFNRGLEETVPLDLASPSSGYHLVTVIGDFDGFHHDDVTVPASTRLKPTMGSTRGLAFAEANPSVFARITDTAGQYSTDGGSTWTAFPSTPSLSSGGGSIAISADGSRFVWMPSNKGAYVSTDRGTTWTASAGSPSSGSASYAPVADRANGQKFYVFNSTSGVVYRSTDGGASFAAAAADLPAASGELSAAPGVEGDLWLAVRGRGLYRSTDSGGSFTKLATVDHATHVGFGKAAAGSSFPAVFILGTVSGTEGLYRSDDGGSTWVRINDDAHRFGWINKIAGDPRIYGRLYIATGGRGVVYGDIGVPVITAQPSSIGAAAGSQATLSLAASGATSYQWYKDGVAVPGATSASYTIASVQASDAGSYHAVATGPAGSATSSSATLALAPAVTDKLSGISTRAYVGTGFDIMVAGFTIQGTQPKTVLIRASGPSLAPLLPAGTVVLPNPTVKLYSLADPANPVLTASNDDWDSSAAAGIAATAQRLQEFAWTAGSKDAALLVSLQPGSYTVEVADKDSGTGVALVEVYDADAAPTASKLVNISTRAYVKSGTQIEVAGFAITGAASKRLLIRAAGPALTAFLKSGTLADPAFNLFNIGTGGSTLIGQNNDWPSDQTYRNAFVATGEFPFPDGSKDSALIATLAPGLYTAEASDNAGGEGIAIVEVYEYP